MDRGFLPNTRKVIEDFHVTDQSKDFGLNENFHVTEKYKEVLFRFKSKSKRVLQSEYNSIKSSAVRWGQGKESETWIDDSLSKGAVKTSNEDLFFFWVDK